MAVPVLSYECELLTNTKKQSKIQASELMFLKLVKRCSSLDQIRNEDIREELRVSDLNNRLRDVSDDGRNTYMPY